MEASLVGAYVGAGWLGAPSGLLTHWPWRTCPCGEVFVVRDDDWCRWCVVCDPLSYFV